MANEKENSVSLWGRLGVQIDMTPEEFAVLKKNDEAAKDLLVKLIKSDRCFLSGESYFPEGYPNERYVENDYDFEFDIDYQPIQKEHALERPLDAFIEEEVPFRLKEILDIEPSEEIINELINQVKADTHVMFDYDHFDIFLEDKYEELCGVDREAIKKLQEQISFLRDEIDGLIMLNGSEDLISMKEKQVAVLECQLNAEKVGVKLHLKPEEIIDAEHLDCFWYDGSIGAFEYKGYTVSIEVHGDVRFTLLDGAHKEELLIYNNRDNSGAYQNDKVLELIKDDETFHKLIEDGRIVFSNNNWVEWSLFDKNGCSVDLSFCNTILNNNILEAFEDVSYFKNFIDELDKTKDLDDVIHSCEEMSKNSEVRNIDRSDKER